MKKTFLIILVLCILLISGCKKDDIPLETYQPSDPEITQVSDTESTTQTSEPETEPTETQTEPSETETLPIVTIEVDRDPVAMGHRMEALTTGEWVKTDRSEFEGEIRAEAGENAYVFFNIFNNSIESVNYEYHGALSKEEIEAKLKQFIETFIDRELNEEEIAEVQRMADLTTKSAEGAFSPYFSERGVMVQSTISENILFLQCR